MVPLEQSGSSASTQPSLSSSTPFSHSPMSSLSTRALVQAGSSLSVEPSLSLSMPSLHCVVP